MPDWRRILPDADHRWTMGLRPSDASEFFRPRDPSGDVLRERARWLADEPHKYVVVNSEAAECLRDSSALARRLGFVVPQIAADDAAANAVALGCTWECDFAWLLPSDDGPHRVVGGVVCFPSSWDLREKVGRPLSEVHAPVPGLNSSLGRQIDTFLAKLVPGSAWARENWSLSRDNERNQHTSRPRCTFDGPLTLNDVWVRLEHQLLLRLPTSGGMLFGIRIELVSLSDVRRDEEAARRLSRAVATMTPEAAEYKIFAPSRERIVELLTD
ncbi:MAG: DUF3445 domain-containing protein [Pirellulales bacterium]